MRQVLPFSLPVLLLVLLAGCSSMNREAYMTNAECRQAVDQSPDVQALIAKRAAGYQPWTANAGPGLDDLRHQVYADCLRRKGLVPKGGVEPVRRNWF